MTIKDIKDNQELLNAYNNMLTAQDAIESAKIQSEATLLSLKANLKTAIETLIANPHYDDIADDAEKQEIQALLDQYINVA
jgi:hypothetical protein